MWTTEVELTSSATEGHRVRHAQHKSEVHHQQRTNASEEWLVVLEDVASSANSNLNWKNSTIVQYDWSGNLSRTNGTELYFSSTALSPEEEELNNWWALLALLLVLATAAGNILVCLAICWERRLQNVTNYFLMSLAVTDLMVAVLVMPLGILTLVRGEF